MPVKNFYQPKEKEKSIYSSSSVANSSHTAAAGTQNAPRNNVWNAEQSTPRSQSSMVQKPKREKSPSELGVEVIRVMLEDEGLLEPPEPEENETPAARTFTAGVGRSDIIGPDAYAARSAAPGNSLSVATGNAGEDADPIQTMPKWMALMPMQDPDYPGLASTANQAGFWLKDNADWLAPEWLSLMSMSNSDYPGVPAAANQAGFWLKDKAEQLTPDKANQLALDWMELTSMSNSDYPGVPAAANQAGFWLKDKNEQLWKDTHLAPGALVEDYLRDSFKSGAWSGLENMRNGMVDLALIGTNADLEQQRQQAQQLAFLGGRYQHHADSVSDVVQSVREELPEAAESFRSHEAAEYARQLDEMYEAGGYYRLGGDIASKIGKMAPDLVMKLLTGGDIELIHTVEMGPLYVSAAGRAAAEARAGGADEETAQLYGMLSGSIEVAAKGFGDFFFGEKRLNDWLKGMVQSKTIRTALVNLTRTLGNDLKTFVTKIAEEYFARMWNDDERDFLQVAGETGADVIYQKLVGTLANAMLNASPNTMPNTTQ